jgi:hypothetical protein
MLLVKAALTVAPAIHNVKAIKHFNIILIIRISQVHNRLTFKAKIAMHCKNSQIIL